MTPKIRLALASVLAVCALGAIAPAANADIYWGDYSGIGRASLDGFDVNSTFVTGGGGAPGYVAMDPFYIYWTNLNGNIGRTRKDSPGDANQSFISVAPGAYPEGIAVGSGSLFWANYLAGSIGFANSLDGGNVNSFSTPESPYAVALGTQAGIQQRLYWSNTQSNTIGVRGISDPSLDDADLLAQPVTGDIKGLAVDSKYIYWANNGNNTIGRAKLDGTDVRDNFITGAALPQGVAVDANYIYWGNFNSTYIGRAKLDGTGVEQQFINVGANSAVGIAVDPSPSLTPIGKATKRSLKVKVECGDGSSCSLRLTGTKVGTKLAVKPKTVTVSQAATVTLTYSAALRKALAKGGRVSITATNTTTDAYRSTVVRVAK